MQDFPKIRDTSSEAPLPTATGRRFGTSDTSREPPAEDAAPNSGRALYQAGFFVCTIKNVGDIPGGGSIYLEIVVDRDSGVTFAKVYPARSLLNGLDILTSRVIPFFERQGAAIGEIHTPNSRDYCGPLPKHPFHTFLATSQIKHVAAAHVADDPHEFLCEQFYWFLLKEFFQPALRKTFRVSLDDLQRDLDAFLKSYNSTKHLRG
jgi:hypothetical protein